jgi:hypothetical protein
VRHPAEFFIKFVLIREPTLSDAQVLLELQNHGFLPPPDETYLGMLRQEIPPQPAVFTLNDKNHRPSTQYMRDQGIYDLVFPDTDMNAALDVLFDTSKRVIVEQAILTRLDLKLLAMRLNKKHTWHLTEEMLSLYRHCFWNVNLLTFDHWGRYLYGRSAMYANYMTLLRADQKLSLYHLRMEQVMESKDLIRRAQEIAAMTLEEVAMVPGVPADKIKAIGVLGKVITDCHAAMSTSDMAMGSVLKQLQKFRVTPSEAPARSIHLLAPAGNFTGSGAEVVPIKKGDKEPVH